MTMFLIILAAAVSSLLSGPGPRLPKNIRFGMDVKAACTILKGKPLNEKHSRERCLVEDADGLRLYLWSNRRGGLNGLKVTSKNWLGKPLAAQDAVKAWGQPKYRGNNSRLELNEVFASAWWDNVDGGVRARLVGGVEGFVLEPLTTIERILGTTGQRLAVEDKQPILGSTKRKLLDAFQPFSTITAPTTISIQLGSTTSGTTAATMSIVFRNDIAISYTISLWIDLLEARDAEQARESIEKRLADVYGKPELTPCGKSMIFPGPPIVRSVALAEKSKNLVTFTVGNCDSNWTKHDLGNGVVLPCIR